MCLLSVLAAGMPAAIYSHVGVLGVLDRACIKKAGVDNTGMQLVLCLFFITM